MIIYTPKTLIKKRQNFVRVSFILKADQKSRVWMTFLKARVCVRCARGGQVCTHSTSIVVLGGVGAGGGGGHVCTHSTSIVVLGGAGAGGRSGQVCTHSMSIVVLDGAGARGRGGQVCTQHEYCSVGRGWRRRKRRPGVLPHVDGFDAPGGVISHTRRCILPHVDVSFAAPGGVICRTRRCNLSRQQV